MRPDNMDVTTGGGDILKRRNLHGQQQACSPTPPKVSIVLLHVLHHQYSITSPGRLIQILALRNYP